MLSEIGLLRHPNVFKSQGKSGFSSTFNQRIYLKKDSTVIVDLTNTRKIASAVVSAQKDLGINVFKDRKEKPISFQSFRIS